MKDKLFTEEEIFYKMGCWFVKHIGLSEIQEEFICTSKEFQELKNRFRTPQGFKRAIKRANLEGLDFNSQSDEEAKK